MVADWRACSLIQEKDRAESSLLLGFGRIVNSLRFWGQ